MWARKDRILPLGSRERNFVFHEHRVFFIVCHFFGLYPITKSKTGGMCYHLTSNLSLTIGVWLIFALLAAVLMSRHLIMNVLTKSFAPEDLFLYLCFFSYPMSVIMPVISYMESSKFADLLNSWNTFRDRFESTTHRRFPETRSFKWIIFIFGGLFVAVSFVLTYLKKYFVILGKYHLDKALHDSFLISFGYSTLCLSCLVGMWHLQSLLLSIASESLIEDIQELVMSEKNKQSLEDRVLLWLNIRQLCIKVGNTFCGSILYLCSIMFLISLPVLYVSFSALLNGDVLRMIVSTYPSLFVIIMADFTHRAVNKVGNDFEQHLTDMLLSGRVYGYREEITKFLQVIAGNRPYISFAGYFEFDRRISVSLVSTIITYLIIIMQFNR